ncbi:hypothetical protein D3C77_257700 [compost metagenome]
MLRRGECDPPGYDAGQRLTAHLHPGQIGIDADAAGVPESRVLAHQAGVGRLDEHFDLNRRLIFCQAIAFHPAHLDLLVEHRAVAVERAKAVGLERQVQARLAVRQWRRHIQCLEAPGRFPLPRAHGNVVARNQGLKPGNTGQADTRLDQPESRTGVQVRFGSLVHFDGRDHAGIAALVIKHQLFDLTNRHALEHYFGLVGDNTFATFKANLDIDSRLAVRLPAKPAAYDQGDQRQYPYSRPVRSWAGFSRRQITHGRHPTPCYPKSVGDRKLLQRASSKSPHWRRRRHPDWLRHWRSCRNSPRPPEWQ